MQKCGEEGSSRCKRCLHAYHTSSLADVAQLVEQRHGKAQVVSSILTIGSMYIIYALLGAVMASIGTIFAKLGLKGVDANLLTAIRGIVMAIIVSLAALSFGKLSLPALSALSPKQWLFVVLSAAGGALSWIFFYQALATGPTVAVTVIDKLSIVFTAILAIIVLAEGITLQAGIGLAFVLIGTLLVSVPWQTIKGFFGF